MTERRDLFRDWHAVLPSADPVAHYGREPYLTQYRCPERPEPRPLRDTLPRVAPGELTDVDDAELERRWEAVADVVLFERALTGAEVMERLRGPKGDTHKKAIGVSPRSEFAPEAWVPSVAVATNARPVMHALFGVDPGPAPRPRRDLAAQLRETVNAYGLPATEGLIEALLDLFDDQEF